MNLNLVMNQIKVSVGENGLSQEWELGVDQIRFPSGKMAGVLNCGLVFNFSLYFVSFLHFLIAYL